MRWMLRTLCVMLATILCGIGTPSLSVQPDEILADSRLEARARDLSRELRCMVCQNQSIDDSDAPLARDLRLLVRERLMAGDSDSQVLDFLTARYGEFVLLKPRWGWGTAILWIAPAALLLLGVIWLAALLLRGGRGQAAGGEPELSEAERMRLARLIGDPPAAEREITKI
jgi:cytochrome c-type biogenesis protein CcmH